MYEHLFLTEARIAGSLDHPHIVSLHDLGKLDNAYFMSMEYVHGISGAELLSKAARARGFVELAPALRIVALMAEALNYCHNTLDLDDIPLGILHHDVSPHNIQIGFDGAVKLLDFGVATRLGHDAPRGRRGKFAYMSPEAISEKEIDHRSDLFSLGVILYELTLGRRLFKGKSPDETMERVLSGRIRRPTEVRADYPPELESALLRVLSLDADDRHLTGEAFASELRRIAHSLELDLSREGLVRYLDGLYGDEILTRKAELAALSTASLEQHRRRRRRKKSSADNETDVVLMDSSIEELSLVSDSVETPKTGTGASAVSSDQYASDLKADPASTAPIPIHPDAVLTPTPIPEFGSSSAEEARLPDPEPSGEFSTASYVALDLPSEANDRDPDVELTQARTELRKVRRRSLWLGIGAVALLIAQYLLNSGYLMSGG
jgi:serine/threonine-protein kinase